MKKIYVIVLVALALFVPFNVQALRTADIVWTLDGYLTWHSPHYPFPTQTAPANAVSIIETAEGKRGLLISERPFAWMGIEIRYASPGLAGGLSAIAGDRIMASGRVLGPQDDTEILLTNQDGSVFDTFILMDDGVFNIAYTLTENDLNGFGGFMIATNGTEIFYVEDFVVARTPSVTEDIPNWDLTAPSLADAFSSYFLMGNIWSNRGQMSDVVTFDMFNHHYNSVTASNHHKVSFLLGHSPNEWNWDFALADTIVDWAEANDLSMVGHTLVWHTQSQPWLTNASSTENVTRATAIENMHKYISTVAGRYRGRMYSWDVVNEVIAVRSGTWWGANPDWRVHLRRQGQGLDSNHTQWYNAFANGAMGDECGSDYIFYAFRFARIYDPYAILYYNDYNTFQNVKREAIAQMVEQINERWTNDPLYDGRLLIEGIGMQGHYNLRNWPANIGYVRDALERFVRTGARVSVTELNVYLEGGGIVPTDDLLPDLFEEQARRYYELFSLFLEFADYIPRITSFIWQDLPAQQGAWRRWPHSQRPALFDTGRQTKPAFYAVLRTLETATPANISIPAITPFRIPLGETGTPFSAQLKATQTNHAPIRWHVESGNLPQGIRLVPTTGVLLGTPEEAGAFIFNVIAENALGSGSREFLMVVGEDYAHLLPEPYEPEAPVEDIAEVTTDATPSPQNDENNVPPVGPAIEAEDDSFSLPIGMLAVFIGVGVAVGVALLRRKT